MTPLPRPSALGDVQVDIIDGTATIEFSHPKANSLPGPLLRQLADAIVAVARGTEAHVIVLRSGGTGPFCAGASFDDLKAIRDRKQGKEFFMGFARVILAMIRAPQLIIARVQGPAVGGALGLVAAADYVIAAERASVRLSELAIGIGPFVVGPVVEKKVGLAAFSAMAVDADWRTAHWAERVGLYSRVLENIAALDDAVDATARQLACSNPEAAMRLKQAFWEGTDHWENLLEDRAETNGSLVLSDHARAAIAATSR